MCGIFVFGVKGLEKQSSAEVRSEVLPLVHNRGPDSSDDCFVEFFDWKIEFFGSVLWMQGKEPVQQPARDEGGNILLWNGDIFDGPWFPEDGESDTDMVLKEIFGNHSPQEATINAISKIKGPFSFVYWCERTRKLWFGRDRIGRHSLLCHFEENGNFILSSVGKRSLPFFEVPVVGIFVMDFSEDENYLTVYPWSDITDNELYTMQNWPIPITLSEIIVNSPICAKCPEPYDPTVEYSQTIEGIQDITLNICDVLLSNARISVSVELLIERLRKAVRLRSKVHPGKCRNCLISGIANTSFPCPHSKVGILFSGGLDSTIMAALAHDCIPPDEPIDLFNVAFENYRKDSAHISSSYSTPDRTTGLQSTEELQALFPNRQWNFVQINISREELDNFRRTRIGDLIHPLISVLDDSLGCALWFASRLRGILRDSEYKSSARVLFLGMGADEQFGGYMRHRTILQHKGWSLLAKEMDLELQRIASRNLGRDDRIVSDHGCQARYPFLDEDVINFASSLRVWERCYPVPELPPGYGDKLLLRLVAWKLGLKKAALYPKRALQFGSRIANGKERATDISSRLLS